MSLSINTLFGSFNNSSANSSFTSGLYSSLSEYSTIRSGAYKKLVSSYYSKTASADKSDTTSTKVNSNKNAIAQKRELTEVRDAADSLYKAASKLTDTSTSKSLFKKADKVTNDITSAVKDYVKNYNSLLEEAADTTNSKVTGKVSFMTGQTNAYKSSLEKVGITINSDKTLSIDEDTFKKSDEYDSVIVAIEKAAKTAPLDDWTAFAKATKLKAAALKKVRPFITEKDPAAQPIEGEPDVDLRDTENISFTYEGGIDAFIKNEVLTYAPDAWVDEKKTQIGYEISFTKYFYKPVELRDMSDILDNLASLEKDADGLLAEILEGVE